MEDSTLSLNISSVVIDQSADYLQATHGRSGHSNFIVSASIDDLVTHVRNFFYWRLWDVCILISTLRGIWHYRS